MIKYIKIIILVFLLAQANSFSKTIKFLVVNGVTGAEIKPDDIFFENCKTHKQFTVTSDSLILTEIDTPTSNFTNSGADFKLKANLASNNLILDIDNISAEKVSVELYGYLGASLYSQDISLFSGMNHNVIPLDFTNEKLLFLRVKSQNSIANVKLNRTAESCTSEIRSITKPIYETLEAYPIDTAFTYNISVFKKKYRSYYYPNVSFANINSYTVKLFEIPKIQLIQHASCKIDGIKLESHYTSGSSGPTGSEKHEYLDTTIFITNTSINNDLYTYNTFCGVGYYVFPYNYADVGTINKQSGIGKEIKSLLDFSQNTMDSLSFVNCTETSSLSSSTTNSISIKIYTPIKYTLKNNKYYFRIGKNEILQLLNSNKLIIYINDFHSYSSGGYSGGSSRKLTQILEVAEDAYIEIAFWE